MIWVLLSLVGFFMI